MTAIPSNTEVAEYYNNRFLKPLRDYVYGNARVQAAADRISSIVTEDHRSLLDIGCGIGIATQQIAAGAPHMRVVGVDISDKNIEIANKLFKSDRLSFSVSEMSAVPGGGPYDVVVLIDVFEHIPKSDVGKFNEIVASCLAPNGVLILTTPTPLHQEYLKEHEPDGLQIVDEVIELKDIAGLCDALGGTLTTYEFMDVWFTNDYLHVVIERNPKRETKRKITRKRLLPSRLTKMFSPSGQSNESKERQEHVRKVLGVDLDKSKPT